jgi:hypothetical protein
MLVSISLDFATITIMRGIFSSITKTVSILRVAFLIITFFAIAVGIILFPIIVALIFSRMTVNYWFTKLYSLPTMALLVSLNVVTMVYCLIPVVLLAVVLLNKVLWPLASRMLYPLSRYKIVTNRKVLIAIGSLLLILAIHPAALARIIHDLEDTKSLFCYKHVVETVFVRAREAFACLTIARHSVCCYPIFFPSLWRCSSISGRAVPTAELCC